jgi:hypothetical protein
VLIGLDDPGALDPQLVGAKAARLALARRAGISALYGVVIEVAVSLPNLAEAARVARLHGPAAGQLAMMDRELPAGLADAVREAVGSERLVVRSSSPIEESGEWSGAFASYSDVGPGELETAVLGCWSSMLRRDALARFEQAGRDPAATGMAVLVQQAITPSPGGVAHVHRDAVRISVAGDGQLAGLLQGRVAGQWAELSRGGGATGPAVQAYGLALLERVADLARACHERTGAGQLEWAFAGDRCYLLQADWRPGPSRADRAEPHSARRRGSNSAALTGDRMIEIARAVARFGGASGEELVLPWCFAPGGAGARAHGAPAATGVPARPAGRTGAAQLRCAARALAAQAWQTGADEAAVRARSALARLRDRLDADAVAEICALAPVDAADGSRVVVAAERAGALAVAAAQLFHATDVWRLSPPLLDQLLAGPPGQAHPRPGRPPAASFWEPFLAAVTCANGQVTGAEPASAGLGAGRLLMLGAPQRLAGVHERWVLHVEEPLPAYAPLLWGAAGLVSATGSAAAHLFDVARALGVPAVAGADLPEGCDRAPVVAVDGSAGQVYVL